MYVHRGNFKRFQKEHSNQLVSKIWITSLTLFKLYKRKRKNKTNAFLDWSYTNCYCSFDRYMWLSGYVPSLALIKFPPLNYVPANNVTHSSKSNSTRTLKSHGTTTNRVPLWLSLRSNNYQICSALVYSSSLVHGKWFVYHSKLYLMSSKGICINEIS